MHCLFERCKLGLHGAEAITGLVQRLELAELKDVVFWIRNQQESCRGESSAKHGEGGLFQTFYDRHSDFFKHVAKGMQPGSLTEMLSASSVLAQRTAKSLGFEIGKWEPDERSNLFVMAMPSKITAKDALRKILVTLEVRRIGDLIAENG